MERWNALSVAARRWIVAAVVVASFVLFGGFLNAIGRSPGGPRLSSYATSEGGLAAYDELLAANGHAAGHLRVGLDKATLRRGSTVIAIGQLFSASETKRLEAFVRGGGRLVVGGPEAEDFMRDVGDGRVRFNASGRVRSDVNATASGFTGVRVLRAEGFGSWDDSTGEVVAGGAGRPTTVALAIGSGAVLAVADPSPLTNAYLDRADNAAFGVALVGEARPVAFAEAGHGYGVASGLSALPARWQAALWFGAIAAVVAALSTAKRFGPPDIVVDDSVPARVQYVEAVASTLAPAPRDLDDAVAPFRARARSLIEKRSGVRDGDAATALAEGAKAAGLAIDDVNALIGVVGSDNDLVALGRAVSRLEEH